eukprot:Nitzschia sp. Nitz4//scaffold337_size18511//1533//2330//NITZ4_008778-RA/size18511-processed-gene-0.10-mRNA-1//1//CDS//3329548304//7564//frame0
MSRGDFPTAIGNFTSSLRIIKDLMSSEEAGADDHGVDHSCPCEDTPASPQTSTMEWHDDVHSSDDCCQDMVVEEIQGPPPAYVGFSSDKRNTFYRGPPCPEARDGIYAPYIHKIPLFVSPSALPSRYLDSSLLSEISVAVLFNLALCHQLRAFAPEQHAEDESVESILCRSIALYELAYGIQVQEESEHCLQNTMAIVNNLGQLHRLLGCEEKATKCFAHLLATLLFQQSTSYSSADRATFSRSNEGFIQSVSHLILKDQVASAA